MMQMNGFYSLDKEDTEKTDALGPSEATLALLAVLNLAPAV